MTCPHIVHYIIPSVALIFGTVFLMMGISTGAWIFYSIGGIVILLSGWGFNAAYRYSQRQSPYEPETEPEAESGASHTTTAYPDYITVITDTGALKIEQNPLQKVIIYPIEDPTPPAT